MASTGSGFEDLTWEDLTLWAGQSVLARGKSYKNNVKDLKLTKDGEVLAWVHGTERYATMVQIISPKKLSSLCSCPYPGVPCKHSVAVVITYLETVKAKKKVPLASPNDIRLRMIQEGVNLEEDDEYYSAWEEGEIAHGSQESYQTDEILETATAAKASSAGKKKKNRQDIVRRNLEGMTREELIEFVMNLIGEYPAIGLKIEEQEDLKAGHVSKIVRSLREEIRQVTAEPAWVNSWSGEGNIPDYSNIRDRLQLLLDSGKPDQVVEVGNELWRRANEQLGRSDDEGEIASQITECMEIVSKAVSESSLTAKERILWTIEVILADEFGLLEDSEDRLDVIEDKNAWTAVADIMLSRLAEMQPPKDKRSYTTDYMRQSIMDWAICCLENSGRQDEIIPLLQREASITQCYGTLTKRLRDAGLFAEAKAVTIEGFRQTINSSSGIAWTLEGDLRSMAEQDGDFPLVAAYRALEFFDRSGLDSYLKLKKASEAAGVWPAVREASMAFLETGIRPDLQGPRAGVKKLPSDSKPWPLPTTEISEAIPKTVRRGYPDVGPLISVAIHERDSSAVVRWYEFKKKDRFMAGAYNQEIAQALKKTHPEISLQIWRDLAEGLIREVKPSAYQVAAKYLVEMREVYRETQRDKEWAALIGSIRSQHKLKRTLMEILNGLEGKRIIDS